MLFNTLLIASTASATCLHGLSMFKRAEGDVKISTFGYGSLDGPLNWSSLSANNTACKSGRNQSPINLDASVPVAVQKPRLDIPKVEEAEFENLGTTIEVLVNGTTSFAGSDYRLVQFHMHTPSEHHVNGEYHPLEVHMVHQGVVDNTQIAVIALMFQISASKSSSIINSLSSAIPAISMPGTKTAIPGGIDFTDVIAKIKSSDILQYTGSLTTPPCREGVTFLVVKDLLDVSVADFNKIKKVVKFNARYIQNTPGEVDMIEVACRSGTPTQILPPRLAKRVDATASAPPRMKRGWRFAINELQRVRNQVPPVAAERTKLRTSSNHM